jgi:hypothetical protein
VSKDTGNPAKGISTFLGDDEKKEEEFKGYTTYDVVWS